MKKLLPVFLCLLSIGASDPGERVLTQVPLIDGHNDLCWTLREHYGSNPLEAMLDKSNISRPYPLVTDIPRLRKGKIGGQFLSIYVPVDLEGDQAVVTALEQIDLAYRLVEAYSQDLAMAYSPEDILKLHQERKIACLMGMEGGHMIRENLGILRLYARLGVRYLTLTHWKNTSWGDAATDAPEHDGLTPFGEEVVKTLNQLGILVDLSHTSEGTMADALRVSQVPVIFSHSGVRGINPHPRNVPDSILRMLKEKDGIIMVPFVPAFIKKAVWDYWAEQRAEEARFKVLFIGSPESQAQALKNWKKQHPPPTVTVKDVADHIDYIKNLIGVDYIGIGSDFEGFSQVTEGLEDVSAFPNLFKELYRRGYTEEELKKIAGLNFLRVFQKAQAFSRNGQVAHP